MFYETFEEDFQTLFLMCFFPGNRIYKLATTNTAVQKDFRFEYISFLCCIKFIFSGIYASVFFFLLKLK